MSSDEGKKPDADNKNAETGKKAKPKKKQSRKKKKAAKKAEAKKDYNRALREQERAGDVSVGDVQGNANTAVEKSQESIVRYAVEKENTSIRDQIRENLEEINKLDAVAKITYTKINNKQALRERLAEEFSNYGGVIERQNFGKVLLGENEIREGTNYANKDAEYAAFFSVPKVIKKGLLISRHGDHKGHSFRTVTFAAPVEINSYKYIVGVVVKETGKLRYKAHRILLTDGGEVVGDIKNSTEPTSVDMLSKNEDQGTTISSAPTNSISQKSEKSTTSAEKVERKSLAEAGEAAEGEIEGDSTPEMTERERRRGYTDAEADATRAIIKDFDTMPRSKRLAITAFVRSCGGNNIPASFKKHAAAMMAHWRKGLWIVVDNKSTEKGFYRTFEDGSRLIVINPAKATGKGATDIAYMHELGHDIWTRADAEMRKELYALATEGTTREERIEIRDRYRAGFEARGLKINNEVIREEIFTEFISKALGNPKFFDRFDMSPTRKKGFWQMMKSTYRMAKCFFGKDKQLYMRSERMATAIARVMGAQLLDVAGVGQSVENKYAISSQYDFTKPFYLQVEDYKNGVFPAGDSLLLGGTPDVFTQIGLNPLPMTINQKHVDYALNGTKNAEHHIGEIFLKYLPTALKNPVAIIASKTHNQTSLIAILSITHNGDQITVPVYIDGYGTCNGVNIDSNAVTSVYSRKNAITSYLADAIVEESNGKIGIFYWDKKRAIALLSQKKVTMPNTVNTWSDGSLHSIHENGSPVKSKFKNITESQQFKNWFGDWKKYPKNASKVVNADGIPKILYHQTAEEFTEFDPRRKGAGTNDDETPFGIFLKPTDDDIGLRGKKQMPLYARIVNPLMVQDRYELSQKLKAMSSEYSNLIAQREALSQEYQKKIEDAGKAWAQYAKEYRETHPGATRSEINEDAEFNRLFDAEDILVDEWTSKANDLAIQCKEVITKTLKAKKYDGVFIKKDAGSFGRVVETYIALESTQVKSATDNIGTFDSSNPDIRYSLDDDLFDKDAFFANAMENGGVISHEEAEKLRGNRKPEPEKSQTAEKKPKAAKTAKELEEENKALNKRIRELERANDKLAEGVGRVQRDNREKRSEGRKQEHAAEVAERKAKRLEGKLEAERINNEKLLALEKQRMEEKTARAVRDAQKATENAQKNAEKHIAHEQDKMKRESADLLRRESRAITRIIRNVFCVEVSL